MDQVHPYTRALQRQFGDVTTSGTPPTAASTVAPAVVGGGIGGAIVGLIIGALAGHPGTGAAIGAGVGAVAGGVGAYAKLGSGAATATSVSVVAGDNRAIKVGGAGSTITFTPPTNAVYFTVKPASSGNAVSNETVTVNVVPDTITITWQNNDGTNTTQTATYAIGN